MFHISSSAGRTGPTLRRGCYHSFQHPRSCLLQRGSCNRTRRPRSLRRGRPIDRHTVPRPPHWLPDPLSLLHTLRHGSKLTGTLGCARCPVTRREAQSSYPTGTEPTGRLPRRSSQLRAGASANLRKCPLDLSTAKSAAEGRQSWIRQLANEAVAPQMSDR